MQRLYIKYHARCMWRFLLSHLIFYFLRKYQP
jgi:hypothetical protein